MHVTLFPPPECQFRLYGSSCTKFGFKDSDVNIDVKFPSHVSVNCQVLIRSILTIDLYILWLCLQGLIEVNYCIFKLVPFLKLHLSLLRRSS